MDTTFTFMMDNHYIINMWIIIKLPLLITNFIINPKFNSFLISQIINFFICTNASIPIVEASILMLDFFSGFIAITHGNNTNFLETFTIWFVMIPVITIWILLFCLYISYLIDIKINHKKVSENIIIKKDNVNSLDCPICYEVINKNGYYLCNNKHYFHKSCLEKWITVGKNTCPICRQ